MELYLRINAGSQGIGVFLFAQQYVFSGASFQSSILSMVAAVVGMIPEGLYLLASVALVVKLIVMLMGLFGFANMWIAVFADTGVSMLCLLNSVRILRMK